MNIKELRKLTGLSQSKFAKKYSIPIGTLQGWEAGRRNPPPYIIVILERLVKIDAAAEGPYKRN